jgi:hypothetical protein
MGEGVDPTQMCQSLVSTVAHSEQLLAIADPDLLALFEDWLEELEGEVRRLLTRGPLDEGGLADQLGLSRRGAPFLLTKLQREVKRPAAETS